jgi:hypothetical protein
MVRAIRQSVIVKPGGLVELRSDELRPGATAEVIVLVDSPVPGPSATATTEGRIALLDEIQQAANLTAKDAADWADRARRHRTAASRRHEPPGP